MALRSGPVCAYCKERGHLLSECWALDRKDKKKGNGLVTTSGQSLRSQSSEIPNTFKPSISRRLVSIDGSNAEMKEIWILRSVTVTASQWSP